MDPTKRITPDINWHSYFRYEKCMYVLWKEYLRVFLWLYEGPKEHPWDFLKAKYSMTQIKQHFCANEREKLQKRIAVTKMDISLLFTLLRHTCGLAPAESEIWKDKRTAGKTLESTIYKLKDLRNDFCHSQYKYWKLSPKDLEDRKKEIAHLIRKSLQMAGARCYRSDQVDLTIQNMESELYICTNFPFSDEQMEEASFLESAVDELSKEYENITIPSWFVPPVFLSHKDSCMVMLQNFPCMLDEATKSVTVLTGDLGMGKTTICRYLVTEWLRKGNSTLNLQQYRLVFLVRRKGALPSTFEDLVRRALRETLNRYNFDKALRVLREVKVLWLFDGLHEARGLVDDLMNQDLQNHSFIITSRAEVAWDFLRCHKGSQNESDIQEIMICGLTPDLQRIFVRKFLSHRNETEDEIINILTYLHSLQSNLQQELMNPLKLTLLIYSPVNVMEFSLGIFYDNIIENGKSNLMKKVLSSVNMSERDVERKVDCWFQYLCRVAFDMTKENIFIALSPAHEKLLSQECDNLGLDSSICLSTFLLCERNLQGKTLFRFIHGSQQQYFIARHVEQLLQKNPSASIRSILFPTKEVVLVKNEDSGNEEDVNGELVTPRMRRKSGEAKQRRLRENSRSEESYYLSPYIRVLVMLTSFLSLNKISSEKWMKELCVLLKNSEIDMDNTDIWFDIVKEGKYSDTVVSVVAFYISYKRWYVTDIHVTAAYHLMCKVYPKSLNVHVIGCSDLLIHLEKLLKEASKYETLINLRFHRHLLDMSGRECSDRYIQTLTSESCATLLTQFHGRLTSKGIEHLEGSQKITELSLRINSGEELLALHKYLEWRKHFSHSPGIECMTLIVSAENLNSCSYLEKLGCRNNTIELVLENLSDKNLKPITDLIFQIATLYKKIVLSDCTLTGNGMFEFIDILRKHKVQAKNLLFYSTVPGILHMEYKKIFPPPKRHTESLIRCWKYGRLRIKEMSMRVDEEQTMNVSFTLENIPG